VIRALAAAALALAALPAAAEIAFCERPRPTTVAQQDGLLRMAVAVRETLAANAGDGVAIVARSGQRALSRFGERYSHAGVALREGAVPWSVRQLYYACDEGAPRLFDQGVAGFVQGTDDPDVGYVSIVVVPREAALALAQVASDRASALALLGADYSANAYPYSVRYQNCNQWVAELLAIAWGAPGGRAAAQDWLRGAGYVPTTFDVGAPWIVLAEPFVRWVHVDDHPAEELAERRWRVSMPASIEAFVHERLPGAERFEVCHAGARVVVHRGWTPVGEGCVAGPDDVTSL
jgi:hypothetical protein